MVRAGILSVVLSAGGALGYALAGQILAPPDRAAAAVALFETHCLPRIYGKPIKPRPDMPRVDRTRELAEWGDPETLFLLQSEKWSCTITDILAPMTPPEQQRFDALLTALVEEELPALDKHSPGTLDAPLNWTDIPQPDVRRTFVGRFRWPSEDDFPFTILLVSWPRGVPL